MSPGSSLVHVIGSGSRRIVALWCSRHPWVPKELSELIRAIQRRFGDSIAIEVRRYPYRIVVEDLRQEVARLVSNGASRVVLVMIAPLSIVREMCAFCRESGACEVWQPRSEPLGRFRDVNAAARLVAEDPHTRFINEVRRNGETLYEVMEFRGYARILEIRIVEERV